MRKQFCTNSIAYYINLDYPASLIIIKIIIIPPFPDFQLFFHLNDALCRKRVKKSQGMDRITQNSTSDAG